MFGWARAAPCCRKGHVGSLLLRQVSGERASRVAAFSCNSWLQVLAKGDKLVDADVSKQMAALLKQMQVCA